MDSLNVHRPRNVDWKRAAALLYGDWGTSKAYVIGLAFVAAGFSSLPIILAVCALTGLVGYNYIIICRHFPDGGGVYSRSEEHTSELQSRLHLVCRLLLEKKKNSLTLEVDAANMRAVPTKSFGDDSIHDKHDNLPTYFPC